MCLCRECAGDMPVCIWRPEQDFESFSLSLFAGSRWKGSSALSTRLSSSQNLPVSAPQSWGYKCVAMSGILHPCRGFELTLAQQVSYLLSHFPRIIKILNMSEECPVRVTPLRHFGASVFSVPTIPGNASPTTKRLEIRKTGRLCLAHYSLCVLGFFDTAQRINLYQARKGSCGSTVWLPAWGWDSLVSSSCGFSSSASSSLLSVFQCHLWASHISILCSLPHSSLPFLIPPLFSACSQCLLSFDPGNTSFCFGILPPAKF